MRVKTKLLNLLRRTEDSKRMLDIVLTSVLNLKDELEGTKRTTVQVSRDSVSDLEKLLGESRA